MKKINDGTDAEAEFERIFNDWHGKKVYLERLPDTRKIKGMMKSGFVQARPSDYIMTLMGQTFYAEVKSCGDKVSFPFSNLRPEQWKSMIRQKAADGKYYCFLYNTETKHWYVIEGRDILSIKEQGRNSIKWTQMNQLLQTWQP